MNKTIALIISFVSVFFGVLVIDRYGGAQGGEGSLMILSVLGAPATLLMYPIISIFKIYSLNNYLCYAFYFLQYQALTILIYKYPKVIQWPFIVLLALVLAVSMLIVISNIVGII